MMITRTEAESFLKAFGDGQGIQGLILDEHDSAAVEFGENQALIFEYSEPEKCLVLWSPLFSIGIAETEEDEIRLLRLLLGLNFPTATLGGAHTAVDPDLGVVLLALRLTLDPADPSRIIEAAVAFAGQATRVTGMILEQFGAGPEGESLDLPGRPMGGTTSFLPV